MSGGAGEFGAARFVVSLMSALILAISNEKPGFRDLIFRCSGLRRFYQISDLRP